MLFEVFVKSDPANKSPRTLETRSFVALMHYRQEGFNEAPPWISNERHYNAKNLKLPK